MKNRKWLIIGLSILFVILTILAKLDLLVSIDTFFYKLVTSNINDSATKFYRVITFLGSTKFIVFLCVAFLVLFIILKKKNTGLIITGAILLSTIVNNVLKLIIRRERPDVIKFVHESSFSFPSGHTMAAVTMYGILMYIVLKSGINKTLKIVLSIILGIIPILVAISRIYLGAHFTSDVVGAFIMSIILLLVSTYYIDKKNWL